MKTLNADTWCIWMARNGRELSEVMLPAGSQIRGDAVEEDGRRTFQARPRKGAPWYRYKTWVGPVEV